MLSSVETSIGAGPDSSYGQTSRRFLDLVNKFFDIGLDQYVDLPMIAVSGSQGTGKSSLIEAVSSVCLPRAYGTCTRLPIECRLSHSENPWKCSVSIRSVTDGKQTRHQHFGDLITDEAKVKERIERAQAAVLNPTKYNEIPDLFLNSALQNLQARELSFSEDLVCLEISGPKVPNLTFVDLPGLIQDVGSSGNEDDIKLIERLVGKYIQRQSCINLMTITCETDAATQGAHALARRYDPSGERTVGVLTKPDKIDAGEEDSWIDYLRGNTEPLVNGWFCVKQPDPQGSRLGTSRKEAAFQEECFFKKTPPWHTLPPNIRRRLQTNNLVQSLESILSDRVSKRVPELVGELEGQSKSVGKELRDMGPVVSESSAVARLHELIYNFLNNIKSATSLGGNADQNLLNSLHSEESTFKSAIRATAPDFRPWESNVSGQPGLPSPTFLVDEVGAGIIESGVPIFIDTVGDAVNRARVTQRGLPGNAPSFVSQNYVRESIGHWETHAIRLVDRFLGLVNAYVNELILEQFGQYQTGSLFQSISMVVTQQLVSCREKTIAHIGHLLKVEKRAYTNNDACHRDFASKFKAYYKAHRASSQGNIDLFKALNSRPYNPGAAKEALPQAYAAIEALKTNYAKVGVPITDISQLAMIIPDDDAGAALDIMASASALFEVAYRRFTDYAPQFVYEELVGELHDHIKDAVFEAVGLAGSDVVERCKKYLEEPPSVTEQRNELEEKLKRLTQAREELRLFWAPSGMAAA
ncbi:P-loop containing nucleoside triphosphate hydrolase protein [Amylostereum chailletii]|nr:P-loop containing nucleoside triphosphate hydrolase protein [Amylostereum chailletii]